MSQQLIRSDRASAGVQALPRWEGIRFEVMEALDTRLQAGVLEVVNGMQCLLQAQATFADDLQSLLAPGHTGGLWT